MTARRTPAPIRAIAWLFKAVFLTVRAAFAVALGAAVLGGLPWALVRFAGWPLPHHMLSAGQLKTDLTSPILGDQFYLNAIAIVLWFLWSILAFSFLLELVYAVRRIPAPHVPGLGPAQLLAGFLITAIGVTALLGRSAAPARADVSTVVSKARTVATAPATISTPSGLRGASALPVRESVHHVVPGDSLYKIAEQDLGDGQDWPALFKANAGVVQHDGQRLADPNLILPGWDITIPGTTKKPQTAAPAPATTTPAPSTAAPVAPTPAAPSATGPSNVAPSPAHQAPAAPEGSTPPTSRPAPAAPARSKKPDTASARHTDGRGGAGSGLWIELAGGGVIAASTLLALRAAASRRHRLRSLWANPYWPRPGEVKPLDTPQMPPALRPARTIALTPAEPQGIEDLDGIGELDTFGAPAESAAPQSDQDAQIAAADTPPVVLDAEPNLPGAQPVFLNEPTDADSVGHAEDTDSPWVPVAVTSDGHSVDLGSLFPGLGLTGPGALGAARAMAAAVLATRSPEEFGSKALIPRADAALLLEVPEADLDRLNRWQLMLVDDLSEAIEFFSGFAAARTAALAEYDVPDFDALAQIDDLLDDPEPIVLLAVARGVLDDPAKAMLKQPEHLRLHSVLLGAHPHGTTWSIDADGEVTSGAAEDGVYAFDLSAAGLRAALDVLTHDGERPPIVPPDPHGMLAGRENLPTRSDDDQPEDCAIPFALAPVAADEPGEGSSHAADTIAPASRDPQPGSPVALVVASSTRTDDHEVREQASGAAVDDTAYEQEPGGLPATAGPASQTAAGPVSPTAPRLMLVPAPVSAVSDEHDGIAVVEQILADFNGRAAQIRVLGPLGVHTASGQVASGIRGGGWKIAARLAMHHARGQSLEELAELWPDLDGQKLSDARKNDFKSLRAALKRDVLAGTGTGAKAEFIPRRAGRFHLSPQFVAVDLACFEHLRAIAARAGSTPVRIAAAQAALGLYEGDLLTGMDEEWVIAPRVAVRRDALATATLLAQLAAEAEDHEQALSWWERARGIDDNEEVYRQIMKTQARLGRRADISATKALLEAKLDEVGEGLSPVTRALLGELLSGRTPVLPRTPGA
ncbi:BTAD domain-containing putative transcriptional regulator [Catenulispora rubra]|uniref:BTAD domain-containing putative transcriptional regulator n=1 Tax=Catenulispora rubra TaxID=280293 RepID=UPI00189249E7|nr:BTAD domain-containing putative transcriptional regulator [Catenulispora rubra]